MTIRQAFVGLPLRGIRPCKLSMKVQRGRSTCAPEARMGGFAVGLIATFIMASTPVSDAFMRSSPPSNILHSRSISISRSGALLTGVHSGGVNHRSILAQSVADSALVRRRQREQSLPQSAYRSAANKRTWRLNSIAITGAAQQVTTGLLSHPWLTALSTHLPRLLRWGTYTSLLTYLLNPSPIDALINTWYTTVLLPSGLLHWPMFEATFAVMCFLAWFAVYMPLNGWGRITHIDGKTDAVRKPETLSWMIKNILGYLGSIYLLNLFVPRKIPPLHAPSLARILGEVSLGVVLYDLLFYPFHMWFHKSHDKRVRELHAWHHEGYHAHTRLSPITTVTQHYLDGAIQVAVNIGVQNLALFGVKKHPISRLLHNAIVTYLLVESHSGMDLPWMSHRVFPSVFGGPLRHEKHHLHGERYYHQFFKYLDDWFERRRQRATNRRAVAMAV